MKGVMDACVSAGSNQGGASETWTPKVNWPPGMAAKATPGPAATAPKATTVSTSRRVSRVSLAGESEFLSGWDEVAIYAPLRSSSLPHFPAVYASDTEVSRLHVPLPG